MIDDRIWLMQRINEYTASGDFEGLNKLLSQVLERIVFLTPEMMLTFLKVTYANRHELPAWCHFHDEVHREWQKRGLDAGVLLQVWEGR